MSDVPVIWLRILYIGPQGRSLIRKCISKLKRSMKDKNIKFIMIRILQRKWRSSVWTKTKLINEFPCPGCSAKYVGKTEICFYAWNVEHAFHENSAVYKHLRLLLGCLTIFILGVREKGKMQGNNHQEEQRWPPFAVKTSSVSLIAYMHARKIDEWEVAFNELCKFPTHGSPSCITINFQLQW